MNKAEIEKRASKLFIECKKQIRLYGRVDDITIEELNELDNEREKLEAEQ